MRTLSSPGNSTFLRGRVGVRGQTGCRSVTMQILGELDPRHVEDICGPKAMCLSSYVWDSIEHLNPQPASSREGSRALGAGAAGTNLSANRSVSINPAPDVWPNRNQQTSERITVFIHREFIGQNFGLQVIGSQVSLSKMNFWKDRFLFDKTMDEIRCKWNQRLKCQHRLALGNRGSKDRDKARTV